MGKHRFSVMLAAATLVPIGVLLYFGAHLLRQDRDVEKQQKRANLDIATEQLAHDVNYAVQGLGERLSRGDGIHFTAEGFRSDNNTGLLYQPVTPILPDLSVFEDTTRAELQSSDLRVAEFAYRRLAASIDPSIRAEALIRLGQTMRRRGDRNGALQVFQNLVGIIGRERSSSTRRAANSARKCSRKLARLRTCDVKPPLSLQRLIAVTG